VACVDSLWLDQGENGTILNEQVERNGPEVWGKAARRVDYIGTMDRHQLGVMIIPSPAKLHTAKRI